MLGKAHARMAGALFLLSTAAYLIGSGLLNPLLERSDVLAGLYADRSNVYRARLVPRILSVIGFIGYAGLLTSSCLAIAGHDAGAALYIPGAIFEIVLPLWLLVKGLNDHAEEA